MDMMFEVANALAALHRKSHRAAFTTAKWMVMCTPITARAVALILAEYVAIPMRLQVLATGGEGTCAFSLLDLDGVPLDVDRASAASATVGRMVACYANGDAETATACWDAFVGSSSRWGVIEALNALACMAAHDGPAHA